jgi:hypothetical protein
MTDERAVKIMLRFGLEGKPLDEARSKLKQAAAEFAKLEKEAEKTRKAISAAMDRGEDTRELNEQLQQIEANMRDIGEAARKYVGGQAKQAFAQLREAGERMQQLSIPFLTGGGAIFAAAGTAIAKYTSYVGDTTAASSRWLSATRDMEQSYMRIGAVATERLLPVMEKLADLAAEVASFVEQHPEVVDSALKVATAMLAIGGGLQIAGGAMKAVGAAGSLAQMAGIGGAGAGMAGAGIGASALVTAIIPIAVTATLAYMANKTVLDPYNPDVVGRRQAGANYFNAQFGQDKTATQTSSLAETIERLGQSAAEAEPKLREVEDVMLSQAAVDAYVNYRKAEAAAEEQYNLERNRIVEDYGKQRAELELRYEQQRTQIVAEYNRQRAQAAADFARQQEQAQEDFQENEARIEEDYLAQRAETLADLHSELERLAQNHQKRLRELERDHQMRMEDLAANRDALGMVREQRRYEDERRAAEEEYRQAVTDAKARTQEVLAELDQQYQIARSRRLADFQEQQAEAEEQFAIQQERAAEQFAARLEALDEQYKTEQERLENAKDEALRTLDDQYRREKEMRRRAFLEQLYQLQAFHGDQLAAWQTFYQNMRNELEDFIDDMESAMPDSGSTTGMSVGGYASYGRYTLGERGREYVLTAGTTRALERSLGGRLTQGAILGQAGRVVVINLNAGALSRQERRRILGESRDMILGELAGALGGM